MSKVYKGLTNEEVLRKRDEFGLNILPQQQSKTSLKILIDIIKEPMISLLLVGGGLYLWLGDTSEAIMLFIMIGGVSCITFFQEKRTENALQSLKAMSAPKCRVIRQGEETLIDNSLVVPGDIIRIVEGERIPADSKILESENVYVDESALTGESLPVSKSSDTSEGGDQLTQPNLVYSSTLLKSGWTIAKVLYTGRHTQIGKIGTSLAGIAERPTRIQQETKNIVRIAAVMGLLISLFVVIGMGIANGKWIEGLLQGIAIAMSMMPEEFPVVLTIFMALGAAKIAKKHVLMRNLPALETLGSATVLCVDKTGTLTKNQMEITSVADNKSIAESMTHLTFNQQEIIRIAYKACQIHHDDPMEFAITDIYKSIPRETDTAIFKHHHPISPPQLFMANVWELNPNLHWIAAKGAPEAILHLCRATLSAAEKKDIETQIHDWASKGMRLLAVAESGQVSTWSQNASVADFPFHYVGLIAFADPIRSDVPKAIELCAVAGIRTVMITGDYQQTAKTIAKQLHLPGSDIVVTGDMLRDTSMGKLRHLLAATSVCARIMPEQKLTIVKALQQNGDIVAMTGDGINDAPALKAAHMGISMGKRGTDVAREASDMVLMNDSFASIVSAIFEGRLIFDNIRKAIGFVMAIHIPIALMAVIPIFLGWPPLLTPVHVVILELIIDPACTLVFEGEKAESDIMSRQPKNPKDKIFNRQMYLKSLMYGLIVAASVFIAHALGTRVTSNTDILRTMSFTTLICVNCLLIASYRSDRSIVTILKTPNRAFWGVISGVGLFLIAVINVPAFREVMRLSLLTLQEVMIVVGVVVLALLAIECLKITRGYQRLVKNV